MSSIPSVFPNAGGNVANPAKKDATLSMNDFMNLLTVQLANQDPLNPMNDRDFFAQMAQLGQVQGMDDLKKSLQVTQAQSLMGRTITASRPNNDGSNGLDTVTGVVSNLSIKNGNYMIGIQDENGGGLIQVNMDAIQSVAPPGDLSQIQGLIGKDVVGLATITDKGATSLQVAQGTVTKVFSQDNQNWAQVKRADGSVVAMLVSDIRSVAPGS